MRALDAGADGVIVPMVNSADDARLAVAASKYPPLGIRSWGPVRSAMARPGFNPAVGNEQTVCIVMIETVEAYDDLEAILDVSGVGRRLRRTERPRDLALGVERRRRNLGGGCRDDASGSRRSAPGAGSPRAPPAPTARTRSAGSRPATRCSRSSRTRRCSAKECGRSWPRPGGHEARRHHHRNPAARLRGRPRPCPGARSRNDRAGLRRLPLEEVRRPGRAARERRLADAVARGIRGALARYQRTRRARRPAVSRTPRLPAATRRSSARPASWRSVSA